jgi:hypothetical protein
MAISGHCMPRGPVALHIYDINAWNLCCHPSVIAAIPVKKCKLQGCDALGGRVARQAADVYYGPAGRGVVSSELSRRVIRALSALQIALLGAPDEHCEGIDQ